MFKNTVEKKKKCFSVAAIYVYNDEDCGSLYYFMLAWNTFVHREMYVVKTDSK